MINATQSVNKNEAYKRELVRHKVGKGFRDKKILLTTLGSTFLENPYVFPYLGILYILAIAQNLGMRVKFIDNHENKITENLINNFDVFYTDEFDIEEINQYRLFDLIGISCMTPQGQQAYRICECLNYFKPRPKIIIGGPHATHYVNECIKKGFDFIFAGESERTFSAFLSGDINILSNKLIYFSSTGQIVFKDCLSQEEINRYPLPLRQSEYINKYNYSLNSVKATTLVNSRGCPMSCAFCEDRQTLGKWFSVEHFEKEISTIINLGYGGIMIFDDLFTISKSKLNPYLDILKKYYHQKGLIFRCFGHAHVMETYPQIASLLADAGCVEIGFGAESGSQIILDNVYKRLKVEQIIKFINTSIAAGLRVKGFFMLGLPGETEETYRHTIDLIKYFRIKYPNYFDFDLSVFFPYKGTLIGDVARLPKKKSMLFNNKLIDRTFFGLRPKEGLSWDQIDNGDLGAYKKKGWTSDIVIETYDWKENRVLLSAEKIYTLKKEAMEFSVDYQGNIPNHT